MQVPTSRGSGEGPGNLWLKKFVAGWRLVVTAVACILLILESVKHPGHKGHPHLSPASPSYQTVRQAAQPEAGGAGSGRAGALRPLISVIRPVLYLASTSSFITQG